MNNIARCGQFPVEDSVLRLEKKILVVPERERLRLLHGRKTNVLYQVAVSNRNIHEGMVRIPGGAHSDVDRFDGDAMFVPLNGTVSFSVEDMADGPKPVSRERFEVNAGEKFFLPARTFFRMHNFSQAQVDLIFIAAAASQKGTKP